MPEFTRNNNGRPDIQTRALKMRAESANDKNMTIQATLSTESPVRMLDYDTWEMVDEVLLSSGRVAEDHVPFLDTHDRSSLSRIFGHVEDIATSEKRTTEGVVHFDADDPDAVRAFKKFKNGHARGVSVGYIVEASVRVSPGESIELDGQTFTASAERDLVIATKWRLFETSGAAVQADKGAHVRAQGVRASDVLAGASPNTTRLPTVNVNISTGNGESVEVSERSGTEVSKPATTSGDEQRGQVMPDSKPATPASAETDAQKRQAAIDEGVKLEAKRRDEITKLAGDDVTAEVRDAALNDSACTVERARELFLADLRKQRATPVGGDAPNAHYSGRHERDCTADSLAAAVALRCGADIERVGQRVRFVPETGELSFERPDYRATKDAQAEHERNLERAHQYRNLHSVDLCREVLRLAEIEAPLERRALVTRAMSTPQVSTIYTQAMGALLLTNLGEMADSTQGWTAERDAKSFKSQELHRIEGAPLAKRSRGRKAAHASFADSMESYKVNDFARTLILDRQDIIDDELGAWQTAMDEFARAIRSLRPDIVYALLLSNPTMATDSKAVFHTDHGNLYTSAALAQDKLQQALTALASAQGSGGLNLNLRDAVLVTSETNSFTADQLVSSAEIRESAAANGTANPIRNRNVSVRSDSRINTGFTDPVSGSAVAAAAGTWFVAAAGGAYGVTVGYLEGTNRMPTMNTSVLNSEGRYGLALDVQHTVGAGIASYQGLVKSEA